MNAVVDQQSLYEKIERLPHDLLSEFRTSLSGQARAYAKFSWRLWARPDQRLPDSMLPDGDKLTWLPLAGRGWGKTRVGAQTVIEEVSSGRSGRIALVAETAADARDVMVEGVSGILACSPPWNRPKYEPSKRRVTWDNGAVAFTYNAIEPGQLRGPQFDFAWCDELAKWRYAQETWDNLQFGLRLGTRPRQIITTTPRPIALLREILADPTTHVTRGRTLDNSSNLAPSFLKQILKKYAGTRLGRQELDAEILDDLPGAFWTRKMLEQALVRDYPALDRVVVAVDPSGTAGEEDDGDEIGIVAAGRADGIGFVLEDASLKAGPSKWARTAVALYRELHADCIVAERNFGGEMVRAVINAEDPQVPVRMVTASRGKALRAEPVSLLYEQRRVKHVGVFADLEDQMVQMGQQGWMGRGSPDRLDALVWAITDLLGDDSGEQHLFGV